ncbi:MAG: BrnT family toxin [Acidobacteria bacterium]|nr:BrnT family toxin [Acidobacteriota bacterium]
MAITFDPRKDAVNRRKHDISLSRAEDFDFETAIFVVDDREDYDEVRYRALGFLEARLYSLVFTQDGEDIRAISLRKATRHEAKECEENG